MQIVLDNLYIMSKPIFWNNKTNITNLSYAEFAHGIRNVKTVMQVSVFTITGLGSLKLLQRCLDEVYLCMLGNLSYGAAFFWTAFVADDISYYIGLLIFPSFIRILSRYHLHTSYTAIYISDIFLS